MFSGAGPPLAIMSAFVLSYKQRASLDHAPAPRPKPKCYFQPPRTCDMPHAGRQTKRIRNPSHIGRDADDAGRGMRDEGTRDAGRRRIRDGTPDAGTWGCGMWHAAARRDADGTWDARRGNQGRGMCDADAGTSDAKARGTWDARRGHEGCRTRDARGRTS